MVAALERHVFSVSRARACAAPRRAASSLSVRLDRPVPLEEKRAPCRSPVARRRRRAFFLALSHAAASTHYRKQNHSRRPRQEEGPQQQPHLSSTADGVYGWRVESPPFPPPPRLRSARARSEGWGGKRGEPGAGERASERKPSPASLFNSKRPRRSTTYFPRTSTNGMIAPL